MLEETRREAARGDSKQNLVPMFASRGLLDSTATLHRAHCTVRKHVHVCAIGIRCALMPA